MTAVLDPTTQTGFLRGYYAVGDDDRIYLVTADGAIPADGEARDATEITATAIGSDWFVMESELVISAPVTPITVGNNAFEGRVHGYFHGESETVFLGLGIGLTAATVGAPAEPDETAPTLSSPTDAASGSTGGSLSVSTNEANGTLYWFVSTSATPPSAAALKAGTGATDSGSQSVSATGVQNATADGLTAETAYYAHFLHRDAAGNDSTIATADGFTTEATPSGSAGEPMGLLLTLTKAA